MLNWTDRRRLKQARELYRGARKLVRINRDVLHPSHAEELTATSDKLAIAVAVKDVPQVAALADKLDKQIGRIFPRQSDAGLRENVEVLLVAAIVAMAVRTFFVQPFKIPTGSMQPTLYGIVEQDNCDPNTWLGNRLVEALLCGRWPTDPRRPIAVRAANFLRWIALGDWPRDSQCLMRGDHVFVDRFSYHFRRPRRGEVIVFDTRNIEDLSAASRGKFYIKRLIGLENDEIRITPPYVRVNGQILDGRPAFQRIYSQKDGYSGYVIPTPDQFPPGHFVNWSTLAYRVPPAHLFVLGDNSRRSLDGRYWGSVPSKDLVGRAVFVYWPFLSDSRQRKRFGFID